MINAFHVGMAVILLAAAGLVYLLYVYSRLYREMKQPFTLGLIIFAAVLLLQTLLAVARGVVLIWVQPEGFPRPEDVLGTHSNLVWLFLIPWLLQLAAIGVLIKLTRL